MKNLLMVLLCAAALLLAGTAHAYAIYNHVDAKVCVQTFWSDFLDNCKYMIGPNGVHNGEAGSSLSHVQVVWLVDNGRKCRCNQQAFDIPKGGFARIHNDEVKIYRHDGTEVDRRGIGYCACQANQGGKQ